MATSAPPSAALVRTARNEIGRIDRSIATIEQRRAALLSQLAELDAEADGYRRRRDLLEELVAVENLPPAEVTASAAPSGTQLIKGADLRRVAGKLLWSAQGEREVHYREWFERVVAAGYAVGGKDPVASFLTNIRDSPAVRRGSSQGHYRLDLASIERVAQEIREAHAELNDVEQSLARTYAANAGAPTEALRDHRDHLKQLLKRLDANMQELQTIFEDESALTAPVVKAA
jgi:Mg2+ and Co2+ transporter CorA